MSTDLTTTTEPKRQPPKDINPKAKAYAFERSLGIPPCEACRRAGGNDRNGQATKWERSRGVQAWIGYYRSLDCTEEMLAEKRRRYEQRLEMAAFGNILDFSVINENQEPVIDWTLVAESPYSVIIAGYKFDKDTGRLIDFERDSALQAIAQLRDMHGFKSVNKTALTDPTGNNPASVYLISEQPMTEAEWEAQRTGAA
jgi:hypothetical protein